MGSSGYAPVGAAHYFPCSPGFVCEAAVGSLLLACMHVCCSVSQFIFAFGFMGVLPPAYSSPIFNRLVSCISLRSLPVVHLHSASLPLQWATHTLSRHHGSAHEFSGFTYFARGCSFRLRVPEFQVYCAIGCGDARRSCFFSLVLVCSYLLPLITPFCFTNFLVSMWRTAFTFIFGHLFTSSMCLVS